MAAVVVRSTSLCFFLPAKTDSFLLFLLLFNFNELLYVVSSFISPTSVTLNITYTYLHSSFYRFLSFFVLPLQYLLNQHINSCSCVFVMMKQIYRDLTWLSIPPPVVLQRQSLNSGSMMMHVCLSLFESFPHDFAFLRPPARFQSPTRRRTPPSRTSRRSRRSSSLRRRRQRETLAAVVP